MATGIGVGISSVFETTVGTPAPAFENLYSLNFNDGTVGEWLWVANDAAFTPDGPWTASLWYKGTAKNSPILAKMSTNYEFFIAAGKTTGYPRVIFYGDNNGTKYQLLAAHIDVTDGDWHHIAVTFDGNLVAHSSTILIYVDGIEYSAAAANATYGVTTWVPPVNTPSNLTVATSNQVTGNTMKVDEVSIFSARLPKLTVEGMYNGGTPTDLTGMVGLEGWWRNGDPLGTAAFPTIVDHSPNGNDGTMNHMYAADIVTDVP